MENILKNIIIGLIFILVVAIIFFFWKMTPKTEEKMTFMPPANEKKETVTPKSLQFKTGFETYKKSDKKEQPRQGLMGIDHFKNNK